jgi:hypothetical protein
MIETYEFWHFSSLKQSTLTGGYITASDGRSSDGKHATVPEQLRFSGLH